MNTTKNDAIMNVHNTVREVRIRLGEILDMAEYNLTDENPPNVRRDAKRILDAIFPVHEDLYQVEQDLKKD